MHHLLFLANICYLNIWLVIRGNLMFKVNLEVFYIFTSVLVPHEGYMIKTFAWNHSKSGHVGDSILVLQHIYIENVSHFYHYPLPVHLYFQKIPVLTTLKCTPKSFTCFTI